jgi:hypothetical protein
MPIIGKIILNNYIALPFLKEYVFYEIGSSFEYSSKRVSFYLEETASQLSNPTMLNERWIGKLKEDKIIDSAYFTSNDQVYIIGTPITPNLLQESGYIVDEMGKLHYVYNDEKSAVFLDAVIILTGLLESFAQDRFVPRAIMVYDKEEETITALKGEILQSIENTDELSAMLEQNPFLIGTQGVTMSRNVGTRDSTLMLISQYPVKFGRRAYNMFGLILIVILTIILAVSIIRYSVYGFGQIRGGLFIMADKKNKGDVISEIDKEISDIIDGEKVTPQTPTKLTDTPTEKFEQKKSDDGVVEQRKKLEADGIIIKKG